MTLAGAGQVSACNRLASAASHSEANLTSTADIRGGIAVGMRRCIYMDSQHQGRKKRLFCRWGKGVGMGCGIGSQLPTRLRSKCQPPEAATPGCRAYTKREARRWKGERTDSLLLQIILDNDMGYSTILTHQSTTVP